MHHSITSKFHFTNHLDSILLKVLSFVILEYRVSDSVTCAKLLSTVQKTKWFAMPNIKWDVHISAVWASFQTTSNAKSVHDIPLRVRFRSSQYFFRTKRIRMFQSRTGGLNWRRRTAMRTAVCARRLRSATGTQTATIWTCRPHSRGTRAPRATARSSRSVGCHSLLSLSSLLSFLSLIQ